METNFAGKIRQMVYGSTPWSAGYSVLGVSEGISPTLLAELTHRCEKYDLQHHPAPPTDYSISLLQLDSCTVFREIYSGWQDQLGRPSRVLRNVIFDATGWELVAGNPFLLLWLLPKLRKCVSKKRNESCQIKLINLAEQPKAVWEKLWWKETRRCLHLINHLSAEEKGWLGYFQQSLSLQLPYEIPTAQDVSRLCRALTFCLPRQQRQHLQLESFSLNQDLPAGITFRYRPYCVASAPSQHGKNENFLQRAWLIGTVVHSLPETYNFHVLAQLWQRQRSFAWGVCVVLVAIIVGLLSRL